MIKGNKELIRDINTAFVIETIIKHAPLPRVEISKITGLTKGTISAIAQNLIDAGLIEETGASGGKVGRKSTMLMLKSGCGFAVSLELRKNSAHIAAFDMSGRKIYSNIRKLSCKNDAEDLKDITDICISSLPQSDYGVVGIALFGVGTGSGLKDVLFEEFGIPVFVLSKANFGVIGENVYSMRTASLALLNASGSVSMGLINSGRLFLGSGGLACDIGHMSVEADGPPCRCGNNGCLELYVSLPAVLEDVSKQKGCRISFEEFIPLLSSGDRSAQHAADTFIKYMTTALRNITRLYNPEIIVVDSPLTMLDTLFLRLKASLGGEGKILYRSMLKAEAPFYGGAVVCIKNFLKIETFTPSMCYFSNMKIF